MRVLRVGIHATVGMHKVDKETCVHTLHKQIGPNGVTKVGRCSRICKHGYIICTENYKMQRGLYAIEGGKSMEMRECQKVTEKST